MIRKQQRSSLYSLGYRNSEVSVLAHLRVLDLDLLVGMLWDIQKGRLLRVLAGHDESVRSLDVFGNRVVSGSYDFTCRVS